MPTANGQWLTAYANPVSLYPALVGLGIGVVGHIAELGAYPLAFLHLVLLAAVGEILATEAVGEPDLRVLHLQAQADVLVDAGLVVDLVDSCRLQRRDG